MLTTLFFEKLTALVEKIRTTQMDAVKSAADVIAPKLEQGGFIFVFGTGHSHVLAEEMYNRAGGLVQVKAVMPHELTVDLDYDKSTLLERTDGLAPVIFATYPIRPRDVLILVSNSGRNPVPVQMAIEARKRGVWTLAITNMKHTKSVVSRDRSGKKLYEVCDMALDTCGPRGDALVPVEGRDYSIAPVSAIAGGIVVESLVCAIVEKMLADGVEPPLIKSANLDGNDDANRLTRERLKEKFPELQSLFSSF